MIENTFVYKPVERDGATFHLLSAQEYPWLNIQVFVIDPADHEETIEKLKAQPNIGWVFDHPTRRDFVVIHAGGCAHPLHFTQENYEQIVDDMKQCMRNAVRWWAANVDSIIGTDASNPQ